MDLCGLIEDIGSQMESWGLLDIPLIGSWLLGWLYTLMCMFCGGF